jgi:hypothetical protein
MMMFRTVKQQIIDILGDNADGRFRVLGHQRQNKVSSDVNAERRLVQVYYTEGTFPKPAGRYNGCKTHDVSFDIDITASASAQGAVSVLTSETATAQQKAAALASVKTASETVDNSIDEVIEAVFNILMDARVKDLALEKGEIANRWIDRIQKDTNLENGDLVVKTANLKYTCRVQEDVPGELGNEPDTVVFDSDIPVSDLSGAGVNVANDNT